MFVVCVFIGCKQIEQHSKCDINKLFGTWALINEYPGRITTIDTLPKELSVATDVTIKFDKDSTLTKRTIDTGSKSQFHLNSSDCIIKWTEGRLQRNLQIEYLDNKYLLVMEGDSVTYFCKRLK
jgi:hypothetical protein